MGNGTSSKMSMCDGCFAGLKRSMAVAAPDHSPQTRVEALTMGKQITKMDEALALKRHEQGTFVPSPVSSPAGSAPWASPMPRDAAGVAVAEDCAVEFDMEIESLDKAGGTLAAQLDLDMPSSRLSAPQGNRLAVPKAKAKGARPGHAAVPSKYEAEMLLSPSGSLPAPMSSAQREASIRSLLPTVTYQMLAKVDPQLLTAADANGQALRRQIARGATLVFISAGLPGKRFAYERAAALGLKVVIIEHPDSWSKKLADEGVIAKFLPVDFGQSGDQIFEDCLKHIRALGKDGATGAADGIATFVELSVPLVARLTEALGLPGHTPAAVDAARNKHATRACLAQNGLPVPRNAIARSEDELEEAGKKVGFPCVMKPVSGAASLGVKKATNWDELRKFYREIVDELSTLVVTSGALVKASDAPSGVAAKDVIDLTVLLEQYLDGQEVDIDVIMSDGDWRYAAVADNGPTLEPYFNETWGLCPSLLPKDQQYELRKLAVDCVKVLGFQSGIFHVECKYTSTGPQLIEVNARMGGGQIFETNLRTWGVDLVEETLLCALGIPSRPPVPKMPLTAVAYCYINAHQSGKAGDLSKLQAMAKREGVVWAKPLTKPGNTIVGPEDGLPTWMADLLVAKKTPKEALAFLQSLEAEQPVDVV